MPDWRLRATRILAEFRRDYGRSLTDPRVRGVVEQLRESSAEFAALWEEQSVLPHEGGARSFCHPAQGRLDFLQLTLAEVERGDFRLIFLRPV